MALEWWTRGKPSVLGMISGAVAGLGTITPASGFVMPMHAFIIGILAGGICFWACTWLKIKLGYDDSLDVFGVHGVGGLTGTILTGVFAVGAISATPELPGGFPGLLEGNPDNSSRSFTASGVTFALVRRRDVPDPQVDRRLIPLRVSEMTSGRGLDVSLHGEALQ